MELTKDNCLNFKFNKKKNCFELDEKKQTNAIKKRKFVIGVLGATFIFALINLYLIFKFFEILFEMSL